MFSARVVGDPRPPSTRSGSSATDGGGTWAPLDLQQCTAPLPAFVRRPRRLARLDRTADGEAPVQYVVQAANGTGLVGFDDNRGQYYLGSTTPAPAPGETSLALVAPAPTAESSAQTVNVTAEST